MLYKIILIDGLYNILCGLCILKKINIKCLNNLHKKIFKDEVFYGEKNVQSKLNETLLGFFILLYGTIRLLGSIFILSEINNYCIIYNREDSTFIYFKHIVDKKTYKTLLDNKILHNAIIISSTYIFEALFMFEEMYNNNIIILEKAFIVCYLSILFATSTCGNINGSDFCL